MAKDLGANGAQRAVGIQEFRELLVLLSLLGTALGNRSITGRIMIADLYPQCAEWGYDTTLSVDELFEWQFLTRREDFEGHIENTSMIAVTECLKAGTILHGGIDIDGHISDLEKSALGRGLELLQEYGKLGGKTGRGIGRVDIE